jgi:hypothetical protein
VGGQCNVGVGRVCHGHVGDEVVEAAVMGDPDGADALEEFACLVRVVVRGAFDEGKAKLPLVSLLESDRNRVQRHQQYVLSTSQRQYPNP